MYCTLLSLFSYLNILSFGAIMTAYLVWRDMRMDAIGFWRGVSSAIGLFGTVCFHRSVSAKPWGLGFSLETTGESSIIFQFSCLLLCYASLFVQTFHDSWSLALLIGGTCASRVGLWVFDISVTQLMQQRVPEDVRGVVGGVQQSLHAMFGLFTFVLGLVFPNPRDFFYFIEVGCSGVGLGLLLFTFGIFVKQAKKTNTTSPRI
jgi:iron-regulated transporter 1